MQEAQQAAVASLQACISSAIQAGQTATAVAAAEQIAACSGNTNAQAAVEALLMAQSARAVAEMEILFQNAAAPQVMRCMTINKFCQNAVLHATITEVSDQTCSIISCTWHPPVML